MHLASLRVMRNVLLAAVVAVGLASIGCHHKQDVAPTIAATNVVSAPAVVVPSAPAAAAVEVAPPPTATVVDTTPPPPASAKTTKAKTSPASKKGSDLLERGLGNRPAVVATHATRRAAKPARAAQTAPAAPADSDTTKSGLKKMTNDDPYAAATSVKTASFDTHPYD